MWKSLFCSFCALMLLPALHAQAAPTAFRRTAIQVGAAVSSYTLDYGDGHEEGFTVYGDVDLSRHFGVEALYRNASIRTPGDIGENHLLIGPRFHIEKGRFSPYAKILLGRGTINFQKGFFLKDSSDSYLAEAIGGGVDFHFRRHINIRLIDLEYMRWPNFPPHGLTPYGGSVGLAYSF